MPLPMGQDLAVTNTKEKKIRRTGKPCPPWEKPLIT